jgi:hypothetical protein
MSAASLQALTDAKAGPSPQIDLLDCSPEMIRGLLYGAIKEGWFTAEQTKGLLWKAARQRPEAIPAICAALPPDESELKKIFAPSSGLTLLCCLAANFSSPGAKEAARAISRWVDVNERCLDHAGESPLDTLVNKRAGAEEIEAMVALGADPRDEGPDGLDALRRSALRGNAAATRSLLQWCDPMAKTPAESGTIFAGCDALSIAARMGSAECAEILAPLSDRANKGMCWMGRRGEPIGDGQLVRANEMAIRHALANDKRLGAREAHWRVVDAFAEWMSARELAAAVGRAPSPEFAPQILARHERAVLAKASRKAGEGRRKTGNAGAGAPRL